MANIYNLPPELTKIIQGEVITPEVVVYDHGHDSSICGDSSCYIVEIKCISGITLFYDGVIYNCPDEITCLIKALNKFLEDDSDDETRFGYHLNANLEKKNGIYRIVINGIIKVKGIMISRAIARTICFKLIEYLKGKNEKI